MTRISESDYEDFKQFVRSFLTLYDIETSNTDADSKADKEKRADDVSEVKSDIKKWYGLVTNGHDMKQKMWTKLEKRIITYIRDLDETGNGVDWHYNSSLELSELITDHMYRIALSDLELSADHSSSPSSSSSSTPSSARSRKKSKKKKSKKRKSKRRKRKSKRKKSKKKSKKRIQTGGAEDDAFWREAGFDAHGEDYGEDYGGPINVFGPDAGAAIATVGAAAAIGGPNAAAATAATLAGAQVMDDTLNTYDRVTNNNLCECRGWHFINSDESQCNGCLPPSGLFSGRRPTPRCPSSNSCCRGRFQGVFGRDELNTVNFIQPGQQQPLRINLCNQCKQSSDEIRDKIKAEFPGLTADTEDGSH